jgi:hypothetical protein
MRPTEGSAGRPLGGDRETADEADQRAEIVAEHDDSGKQADALTRLGEMLKATPKNTGAAGSPGPGRGNAVPIENRVSDVPTLADLGIDKKVSPTSGLSQSAGGKVAR